MEKYTLLEDYNLILIRYSGEIWLKSMKVKMRMIKNLINNIVNQLNHSEIPFHKYQISKDSSRVFFFFKNKDIVPAIMILQKIFGIYSISPSLRTSNDVNKIIEHSIDVGKNILTKNDTFAIRVKRSGKHSYTSQEVAQIVGKAVIDSFSDLKLKVNLSSPKKKIFIEIRNDFSYIYTDIIKNFWIGLPIVKNKRILCMDIGRLNDLLAGFLLMRRGCQIFPVLFEFNVYNQNSNQWHENWKEIVQYLPNMKIKIIKLNLIPIMEVVIEKLTNKSYMCAICRLIRFELLSLLHKKLNLPFLEDVKAVSEGMSLNNDTECTDSVDLETISLSSIFFEYPIFTPVIGFDNNQIESLLKNISGKFKKFEYCKFKPVNQTIDLLKIIEIYNDLELKDLIITCLDNIKEYKIG